MTNNDPRNLHLTGPQFARLLTSISDCPDTLYFGQNKEASLRIDQYTGAFPFYIIRHRAETLTVNADDSPLTDAHTTLIFEVTGNINDQVMNHFNNLANQPQCANEAPLANEAPVASLPRCTSQPQYTSQPQCANQPHCSPAPQACMAYLKNAAVDLTPSRISNTQTTQNLIRSGGTEMPLIIAGMLKLFYYDRQAAPTPVLDCVRDLARTDLAQYRSTYLQDTYYIKIATFLHQLFTGMCPDADTQTQTADTKTQPQTADTDTHANTRTNTHTRAKTQTAAAIAIHSDNTLTAHLSTVPDDFKDFLMRHITLTLPSNTPLHIEKSEGRYHLTLPLHLTLSPPPAH